MTARVCIDDVQPTIDEDKNPAKAVVGEYLPMSASIWNKGRIKVSTTLVANGPTHTAMIPGHTLDGFHAAFTPTEEGSWTFRINAWSDPISTRLQEIISKVNAGLNSIELLTDLEIGTYLLEKALPRGPRDEQDHLLIAISALCTSKNLHTRIKLAVSKKITGLLHRYPLREFLTPGKPHTVRVDRSKALYRSCYELSPHSTGGYDSTGKAVHGTFKSTIAELPRISSTGFDISDLPPTHPIGSVHHKGGNNSLHPNTDDVGSPWAIGSAEGGHDCIHPHLGTIQDFDDFIYATKEYNMEVALNLALPCAPDHSWPTEHPEWFNILPDGSIRFAENPPKKYQDIYPLNFDNAPQSLYSEILRVARRWIAHEVKMFRVDNPHTKLPHFWHRLITTIKLTTPEMVLLAEAFTSPAGLYALAKLVFTQSYTYLTWRTNKWELTEFGNKIAAMSDISRPKLEPFAVQINSIRIQHPALQQFQCMHFHATDNDALIAYSKTDPISDDAILIIVSLHPFACKQGHLWISLPAIGRDWQEHFWVQDELSDKSYHWGQCNFIQREPRKSIAHIIALPPVPIELREQLHRRT
ncbi:MAG: maltotransferase domain-containing protein [Mycobacteriaceae bacterium]